MREKTSIFSGRHKSSWVKDLPEMIGRSVYERFLVCSKPEIRKTKKGDYFLSVELGDKTGRVKFNVWRVPELEINNVLALFKQNEVYALEATVSEYNGEPQLAVSWSPGLLPWECKFDTTDESKTDYFKEDFVQIRERATIDYAGRMMEYVICTINKIKQPGFLAILAHFFGNDDWISGVFKRWPAAKSYHHSYYGGLLEHVYEMLKAAESFIVAYPNIDADLLFTGIILHDIGKLEEYKLGMQIECDEDAFLTGHIVIAVRMIDEVVRDNKIDISKEDLQKLFHLILSHHGAVEDGFGSAVSPKLPEAIALHYLDQLSAKVNGEYVKTLNSAPAAKE
ncbi:HD domain-containing protein [Candidatus Falkowbacteria bacterium]|nr:HD domain-containing protein [Candidatus Falkowbacteria bacterium]